MNEELWRVQLGTGEIRTMTLDALDRAFDEGIIDARAPVLPPGASAWTTLGEAAGLDDVQPVIDQTPSLSPVAFSAPSSVAPIGLGSVPDSRLELELPDNFDALRPRRRGLIVGGVAAVAAAAVMLAVVVARLGASTPVTEVETAAAVEAPPAALQELPAPAAEASGTKAELSDWQKRMLADSDKAREDKARAKKDKAEKARPSPKKKKGSPGLLNGGDRFDPLNGDL